MFRRNLSVTENTNGLVVNNRKILPFAISVAYVNSITDLQTSKEICDFELSINIEGADRRFTVSSLSEISLFKLIGYPDSLMSREDKKLLLLKLQHDVCFKAKKNVVYRLPQGYTEYCGNKYYVLGDRVIGSGNVVGKSRDAFILRSRHKNIGKSEMLENINMLLSVDEVAPVLFYSSLVTCILPFVKAILRREGINSSFVFSLVGPSASGKTMRARLYSLWLEGRTQEYNLKERLEKTQMVNVLESLVGSNILIDDVHSCSGNDKQSQISKYDNIIRPAYDDTRDTAVVVFTREEDNSKYEWGIYSTHNRSFDIPVEKKMGADLEESQKKLSKLIDNDFMPEIALCFVERLMNYKDFEKSIYNVLSNTDIDTDYDVRLKNMALLLLITEYHFRHLMCNGNKELSAYTAFKDQLIRVLNYNQKSLLQNVNNEDSEILQEIATAINNLMFTPKDFYDCNINGYYTKSNNCIVVSPDNICSVIFKNTGNNRTTKEIGKVMMNHKMVFPDSEGKSTRRFYDCNGRSSRHFWILENRFDELTQDCQSS